MRNGLDHPPTCCSELGLSELLFVLTLMNMHDAAAGWPPPGTKMLGFQHTLYYSNFWQLKCR
jgi:hypothetical protein